MKKIIALFSVIAFVYSCGVKQTQSMISEGDYDGAINRAIEGLSNNKNAKGKQDYVYLLEEAFAKAKERDLRTTYLQLNNRQERIRPLLPLQLLKEKRNALFPFDDYSDQIISSKNALAKHLYNNSKALLATNDKMNFRRAYDDFAYLETLSPGFKDVKKLMDEAQFKGTDFVNVYTKNETNMVIPVGLQNDLLDFSTLGLNDKWTVYHSNRQKGVTYDFGLIVNFRDIKITPEQIKEKQIKEKQIKDGVKNLLDANGRVVRDSLGKPIKVDNFRTIKINIYEFTQFKACQITAKVDYIDFKTNQLIETFPLSSEFVFQNIYANYNGDRRASDENYYQYFDRKAVPFPSNEQMVFDTGEDLKSKLKNIITRNKFRK